MTDLDTSLDQPRHARDGASTLAPEQVLEAVRARLQDDVEDEQILTAWRRLGGGPTNRDDIGRVVADVEGIALDG